jgi:hypothetical protein
MLHEAPLFLEGDDHITSRAESRNLQARRKSPRGTEWCPVAEESEVVLGAELVSTGISHSATGFTEVV